MGERKNNKPLLIILKLIPLNAEKKEIKKGLRLCTYQNYAQRNSHVPEILFSLTPVHRTHWNLPKQLLLGSSIHKPGEWERTMEPMTLPTTKVVNEEAHKWSQVAKSSQQTYLKRKFSGAAPDKANHLPEREPLHQPPAVVCGKEAPSLLKVHPAHPWSNLLLKGIGQPTVPLPTSTRLVKIPNQDGTPLQPGSISEQSIVNSEMPDAPQQTTVRPHHVEERAVQEK
ncbi:hypothetical protein PR048_009924 [Dryococelus australis]|uniref:Uncharacterized protein n=1 Tax=Dryococelus australis TaxID=614101 RepID=A0ABQ9I1A2_9NEOP|nr:hypothetical protein PR048_009924 [Dryococelus australis]